MYFGAVEAQSAAASLAAIRDQVAKLRPQAQGASAQALADFDKKAEALQGAAPGAGGRGAGGRGAGGRGGGVETAAPGTETLSSAGASLSGLMNSLQAADVQPTAVQLAAITAARQSAAGVIARWTALKTTDLAALNATLKAAGLVEIRVQ